MDEKVSIILAEDLGVKYVHVALSAFFFWIFDLFLFLSWLWVECIIQKLPSLDSGFQHVLKGLIVISEDVLNVGQGGLVGLVLFDTSDE